MFIYGKLPGIDTALLVKKALEKEVAFVPGNEFYTGDKGTDEIRFNFTHPDTDAMEKGIKIVAGCL